MKGKLPLFYYPSTHLWIDDNNLFLSSMNAIFGNTYNSITFNNPESCLAFLQNYSSPLEETHFLSSITEDEHYGTLDHTPINFDITSIIKLAEKSNRHNEVTTMVIDQSMPNMGGLELAETVRRPLIKKILLTGEAPTSLAIHGFNSSLIHRFVQKATPDMDEKIDLFLTELSLQYFQDVSSPLLKYLETENLLPITDPAFITYFKDYLKENKIKEYYLADKQGSILCIDKDNNKSCLVVYSEHNLKNWLSMYGNNQQLSTNDKSKINEGKIIPFFGLGNEAWQIEESSWSNYFFNASELIGREKYYLATTKL